VERGSARSRGGTQPTSECGPLPGADASKAWAPQAGAHPWGLRSAGATGALARHPRVKCTRRRRTASADRASRACGARCARAWVLGPGARQQCGYVCVRGAWAPGQVVPQQGRRRLGYRGMKRRGHSSGKEGSTQQGSSGGGPREQGPADRPLCSTGGGCQCGCQAAGAQRTRPPWAQGLESRACGKRGTRWQGSRGWRRVGTGERGETSQACRTREKPAENAACGLPHQSLGGRVGRVARLVRRRSAQHPHD